MLREVLVGIVRNESDMQLVAEAEEAQDLLRLDSGIPLDAAIVIAGAEEARTIAELTLSRLPAAKVVVISDQGRNAELYELRPRITRLRQVSHRELIGAIRSSLEDPSQMGRSRSGDPTGGGK